MAKKRIPGNDFPIPNSHVESQCVIKEAFIDKGLLSLIQWLNSFSGVFTRWSCIGAGLNATSNVEFYVSFYCDSNAHLYCILREIGSMVGIEVDLEPSETLLRYRMSLRGRYSVQNLIDLVKSIADSGVLKFYPKTY